MFVLFIILSLIFLLFDFFIPLVLLLHIQNLKINLLFKILYLNWIFKTLFYVFLSYPNLTFLTFIIRLIIMTIKIIDLYHFIYLLNFLYHHLINLYIVSYLY